MTLIRFLISLSIPARGCLMNIAELVRSRHTCKAYDAQRPLTEEQLQQLQEILRLSPSSVNSQPWHFFLVTSEAGKETLIPTLTEHNREKVRQAALTVVIATHHEEDVPAYVTRVLTVRRGRAPVVTNR